MSLEPLLNASPVIQVHALCAVAALLLGAVQLFRKKGDLLHRALGRTWVALIALVALSSFFIWTIRLVPLHRGFDGLKFSGGLVGAPARRGVRCFGLLLGSVG